MLAETPVTERSPCYSAVSFPLSNPLPDCSNYLPFCHTHYLTLRPDLYFTSLLGPNHVFGGVPQCLEEAEQQAEASVVMFLLLLFKLLSQFSFVSFSFLSISILSLLPLSLLPFLISPSLSTIPSFSSVCPPKIKISTFI